MEGIVGEMGAHPKGRLGDRHTYREGAREPADGRLQAKGRPRREPALRHRGLRLPAPR